MRYDEGDKCQVGIAATAPSRAAYSGPKVGHSRLSGMFLLLILSATALAAGVEVSYDSRRSIR